jgi:hypothetical protein
MSDLAVLQAQLHSYRDFDECVVLGVRWLAWGTRLVVDLDFVWKDDGGIRTTDDYRRIVTIAFLGVSELHVVNDLTDEMVDEPSSLTWGVGEIACLRVERAVSPKSSRLTQPSFMASFRREGHAWIEVTFTFWDFTESTQTARESPLNLG